MSQPAESKWYEPLPPGKPGKRTYGQVVACALVLSPRGGGSKTFKKQSLMGDTEDKAAVSVFEFQFPIFQSRTNIYIYILYFQVGNVEKTEALKTDDAAASGKVLEPCSCICCKRQPTVPTYRFEVVRKKRRDRFNLQPSPAAVASSILRGRFSDAAAEQRKAKFPN
jgi:hypothetical protein